MKNIYFTGLIFFFFNLSILNAQWCSGDFTLTIDISELDVRGNNNFKIIKIIEDGKKGRTDVKISCPFDNDKNKMGFTYPNGCGINNVTLTIVNKSTKEKMTLDLNCLLEGYPNFHINKFEAGYFKMNYCDLIHCGKDKSKDEKNDCREKQIMLEKPKKSFPKLVIYDIEEFKEKKQ